MDYTYTPTKQPKLVWQLLLDPALVALLYEIAKSENKSIDQIWFDAMTCYLQTKQQNNKP